MRNHLLIPGIAAALLICRPLFGEQSASKSFVLTSQAAAARPAFTLPPSIAKINEAVIPTHEFWFRLMNESGSKLLAEMVDEILIDQEGSKVFSRGRASEVDREVSKKIADIKKQFPDETSFLTQLRGAGLTLELLKLKVRRDIYKQKLLEDAVRVSPSEIESYFKSNKTSLATPERIHLKHILVATEREANDFLLALSIGASFDLLAKEKSLDAATKDRGGDLGVFSRGMLIPALENQAFSLETGGMGIVQTQMGFHIIKAVEKIRAKEAVLDKKNRDLIEQSLRQIKMNQAYPEFVQKLRKKSKISINLEPY